MKKQTQEQKLERANELGKILNDYIIIEDNERPFVGNVGILKVMDELQKEYDSELKAFAKEFFDAGYSYGYDIADERGALDVPDFEKFFNDKMIK